MKTDSETPAGIDTPAVARWLTEHVNEASPPFTLNQIAGGESNLTFHVVDADEHEWILRRPPLGTLKATAHDMLREAHVMSGLAATAVSVPEVLARCDDPAVTGAPFYVMRFVSGLVLRTAGEMDQSIAVERRARACELLVEALAAVHAADPDACGLGDLGRRDGYVERQLARWRKQIDGLEVPRIHDVIALHERLNASVPSPSKRATLIHGDFRFDNAVVSATGDVRAILDWELATLGEPLADLAITLAAWSGPGEVMGFGQQGPTSAPGCLTLDEAAAHYARSSGREVVHLHWYLAWASWRIASILCGVYARRRSGAQGDSAGYTLAEYAAEISRRIDIATSWLT